MKTFVDLVKEEMSSVSPEEVRKALDEWMKKVETIWHQHMDKKETFKYSSGGKYLRVYRENSGTQGRSAHAFVDASNGDIFKPASWKVPAKGRRGNLFDDKKGMGSIDAMGFVNRLR